MRKLLLASPLVAAALLASLAPAPALAQRQYIDVGSPDFRPLALAVVPFQSGPGAQADSVDVQQTFRDDLALTGIFDLLDPRSFLAAPRRAPPPPPSSSTAGTTSAPRGSSRRR